MAECANISTRLVSPTACGQQAAAFLIATRDARPWRDLRALVSEQDPRTGIADLAERVQWKAIGHVTRDHAGDLSFPPVRPVPAIYRFTIMDGPQAVAEYIGEAVNLVKRFGLYRSRGRKPSLPLAKKTTSRNARKLLDPLRAGRLVTVAVVDDHAITADGQVILIDLADKALRDELEKKLIESLRGTGIEVLNR